MEALKQAGFSSPAEVLIARAHCLKNRCGRRGLPGDLVAAMYRDYQRLNSLSKVGSLYGRTRQMMWDIFHARGLPMAQRNFHARIYFAGQYWTPGKSGHYRSTIRRTKSPPLHHLIWEHATGRKVPVGCLVSFKDGDCTNLRPANLFCATKAEITLHHYRRRYPERAHWTAEDRRRHKNAISLNWYSRKGRRRREQLRGKVRLMEVAHCCGQKYSRWRYEDSDFPPGHTQCCQCRKPLQWGKALRPSRLCGEPKATPQKVSPKPEPAPRRPKLPPIEAAWRELRAEMKVEHAEFLSVLER